MLDSTPVRVDDGRVDFPLQLVASHQLLTFLVFDDDQYELTTIERCMSFVLWMNNGEVHQAHQRMDDQNTEEIRRHIF